VKAAEATECVFEQSADKGWAFRDLIFRNQDQLRSSGSSFPALLKTWAGQVGANQAAFNSCLDSGKYSSLIQKESATAKELKIPGTPAIFVGNRIVQGASGGVPTTEEIGKVIDQAIAQKPGR